MAVAVVAQHVVDNLRNLLLQLIDEVSSLVLLVFYVAQFLLPDAGKLATL